MIDNKEYYDSVVSLCQKRAYMYDIRSTVIRLDGTETKKGCRFGLRVDERDRDEARRALRSAGIVFTET